MVIAEMEVVTCGHLVIINVKELVGIELNSESEEADMHVFNPSMLRQMIIYLISPDSLFRLINLSNWVLFAFVLRRNWRFSSFNFSSSRLIIVCSS